LKLPDQYYRSSGISFYCPSSSKKRNISFFLPSSKDEPICYQRGWKTNLQWAKCPSVKKNGLSHTVTVPFCNSENKIKYIIFLFSLVNVIKSNHPWTSHLKKNKKMCLDLSSVSIRARR
jgi:hypothetical protein